MNALSPHRPGPQPGLHARGARSRRATGRPARPRARRTSPTRPAPTPDSPTVVLLHALGCTGLLTWFPAIEPLSRRYRVVTLDQRWHGQGIQSDDFSLYDCADDVAALIDVLELRRRDRRRLLDGRRRRAAGVAPAPRQGAGARALLDHRPVPAQPGRAAVLHRHGRHACSACASVSRSRTVAPRRARRRRRGRPRADRHPGLGARASSARPARGRSARRSPPSAVTTRARGWPHRRPHRRRRHHQGPGDPRRRARSAWPAPSAAPRCTRSTPATPPACWSRRSSCPAFLEAVDTVNARRRDFDRALAEASLAAVAVAAAASRP